MKVSKKLVRKIIKESLEQRLMDLDEFKTSPYANKFVKIKPEEGELTARMSLVHDDIETLRITIKEIIEQMMKEQSDSNS